MKNGVMIKTILCVLLGFSGGSFALDDELYFQLGGGEPISNAASNRGSTLPLGLGVSWNTNLMCGNFDMSLSISEQLNGAKGSFSNLMGGVINSATAAVSSLPALVIQKVNPALYDLLQNGVLQAGEEFHLAQTSCESMVEKMETVIDGNSWEAVSKGGYWKEQSQSAANEILEAKLEVQTQGLDHGVTWRGGAQAGGAGQPPIEVVGDTVKSGYNMLLQRSPTNTTSTVSTCAGAPICDAWVSPTAHADWVIDVVGEQQIRTCDGCQKMTAQAGMGLAKKIEEEQDQITTDLKALVLASDPPTASELEEISGGPSMLMTRRVVEAIREENSHEQDAIIHRIAGEMALNRTMERALMARRSLLAGMKEPNIANVKPAQEALVKVVDELGQEIDNMLYELNVKSKIAGNTATALLRRNALRKRVPQVEQQGAATLNDGAVPE